MNDCYSHNYTEFYINCRKARLSSETLDMRMPLAFALPLYGYVMPVVVVAALIANIFIVVVMSKEHLRTPTNTILVAMAVMDSLTGIFSLPVVVVLYTARGYEWDEWPPAFCYVYQILFDLLPSFSHTSAVWLTVYVAVQRYVYVCMRPDIGHKWCTLPRTRVVIICLCFAAGVADLPRAFIMYQAPWTVKDDKGRTHTFCVVRQARWLLGDKGFDAVMQSHFVGSLLLVHLLPCAVLVTFTAKLIIFVHRACKRRAATLHLDRVPSLRRGNGTTQDSVMDAGPSTQLLGSRQTVPTRERKQTRTDSYLTTTRMMIAVVTVFLMLEIPVATFFLLHVMRYHKMPFAMGITYDFINKATVVRNVLILITSPINFAVYCAMSQLFRSTVWQLFKRGSAYLVRTSSFTLANYRSVGSTSRLQDQDRKSSRQTFGQPSATFSQDEEKSDVDLQATSCAQLSDLLHHRPSNNASALELKTTTCER